MPKLSLYTYWRSSCSYRVRLGLALKGLAYESLCVDLLNGAQRDEAYAKHNPMGYVPCLVVDGVPFVESTAILELLEELHPEPAILPKDPAARAHVRALVQIINAGTQPLQNLNVLERFSGDKAARAEWARHYIRRGLTAFEELASRLARSGGADGPYVCGAAPTMADLFLVPQLYNARRFSIDLTPFPRSVAADAAASQTPWFAAARPEAQPDAPADVLASGT